MKDAEARCWEMAEALYTVYRLHQPGLRGWDQISADWRQIWYWVADEALRVITDQFKQALAEGPRNMTTETMLATLLRPR